MRVPVPGLFWRTFLLIIALSVISLLAWLPAMQVVERDPRAHQLAQRVISLVDATRLALEYADPDRRRALLVDLQDVEGLQVEPFEPGDRVLAMAPDDFVIRVEAELRQHLGSATRLATSVNGTPGFWVTFTIDDDTYWARIDQDLLRYDIGRSWIGWALIATALSMFIAVAITRVVNRPLARLADAAAELGHGRIPLPLPESGPTEIRHANRVFNQMVTDLQKLEQDRALVLAGVSHDLRTPLTRMRLEIELAALPAATRAAMVDDLEQMDRVVQQFLDYARVDSDTPGQACDLCVILAAAAQRVRSLHPPPDPFDVDFPAQLFVRAHPIELSRLVSNLVENAFRYARDDAGKWQLALGARPVSRADWSVRPAPIARAGADPSMVGGSTFIVLAVTDGGPGLAGVDLERLIRPFERGDISRSGPAGAGLGLAIVDRIARLHGAVVEFRPAPGQGLSVEILFQAAQETPPAAAD